MSTDNAGEGLRGQLTRHFCGQTQPHGAHVWTTPSTYGTTTFTSPYQCAGINAPAAEPKCSCASPKGWIGSRDTCLVHPDAPAEPDAGDADGLAFDWHDATCPEGIDCRSRHLHAVAGGGPTVAIIERIVAARVREAEQRGAEKGWREGALAMKKARFVQGESLPQNPYRADGVSGNARL